MRESNTDSNHPLQCNRLKLNSRQKHALCHALARALAEDPFTYYMYETEQQRREILPFFLENFVNYCLRDGHVDVLQTNTGDIMGGALWMGPQVTTISPGIFIWRMITAGRTLRAAIKLGMRGLVKLAKYGDEFDRVHHQAPTPHYYLSILGIVPEFQRQGLGATLLAPVIEQARKEKLSLYAESTNPKNLTFYERQGFHRFDEQNPAFGPPFFALQMFP